MPYQFAVCPDFAPEYLSGWHIFNTWLQRTLEEGIHLEHFASFDEQKAAILADKVDLIYANPHDASMLMRGKGFLPVARPKLKRDEAIIAVNAESSVQSVEDLAAGTRVAYTQDPGVRTMGMIMLEPADLNAENTTRKTCDSYILVAKELLRDTSDVGFFLAEAFDDLSAMVRNQLRPLVTSQIGVVHHALMLGPALAEQREKLTEALRTMSDDPKGSSVLESLGMQGWEPLEQEEAEFMIDLMDTLVD